MDPQATWLELLDAWEAGDWEAVVDAAEALLSWLDKRGFPPQPFASRWLGQEVHSTVVRAACSFMLARGSSVLESPDGIPVDVPFLLTCESCGKTGPNAHSKAVGEGWQEIRYSPKQPQAYLTGKCPNCLPE